MNHLCTCALTLALVSAPPLALAVTLDRSGTLTEKYECVKGDTVKVDAGGVTWSAALTGSCAYQKAGEGPGGWDTIAQYWFKAGLTWFKNPSYEDGEAKESVSVYSDAARTNKLGSIATIVSCKENPFTKKNVACQVTAATNSTGADILFVHVPMASGVLEGATGTSQQALATAVADELEDWNPYSDVPEGKKLRIQAPVEYQNLVASTPPDYSYDLIVRHQTAAAPASIQLKFEEAEFSGLAGDIAVPSDFPTGWHPVAGEKAPPLELKWASLEPAGRRGRRVPLFTGKGKAAFKPGLYRVRVRGSWRGTSWSPWEPERHFRVVTSIDAKAALAALKPRTKKRSLKTAPTRR